MANTDVRVKPNSESAIKYCHKRVDLAFELIGHYRNAVVGSDTMIAELVKGQSILNSDPVNGKIQGAFDAAKKIIDACKPLEKAAEQAKRSKEEKAVTEKFERLNAKLIRHAPKMADGESLVRRMAVVAADVASIEFIHDLEPFFVFFDEVWAKIGEFENELVIKEVVKARDGWLAGKHAKAYEATEALLQVAAWLANKPLANAHYRDLQEWRQKGWDMKYIGIVGFPFGKCPNCQKNALTPRPENKKAEEWVCGDCVNLKNAKSNDRKSAPRLEDAWKPEPAPVVRFIVDPDEREKLEERRADDRKTLKAQQRAAKLAAKLAAQAEREELDDELTPDEISMNQLISEVATGKAPKADLQSSVPSVKKTASNKGGKGGNKAKKPIKGGQADRDDESAPKKASKKKKG